MTPKNRAPFLIEFLQCLIPAAQPSLKALRADGTVTAIAEFIVNLPADHGWMIGIMISHLGYDALRIVMIPGMIRTVLTPIAIRHAAPIFPDAKQLGIFLHQPGGRGSRGRPQNNTDTF